MKIHINRCICTDRTFESLLRQAQAQKLSFEQLAQCTGASRQCGMCRPYLQRTIDTGQTVFHQLLTPQQDIEAA